MANYAQTRTAPTSGGGVSINHDFRKRKPNYLRDDKFHNQFPNVYSAADINLVKSDMRNCENEFREFYKERTGRNPQKRRASAFMEGVITLSNSVNDMLENGELEPEYLNELFKTAFENQLNKIEDITGTRPHSIEWAIHYDEKTPHLHYLVSNYDDKGRSLHHALKTSRRLSELQDQVGEDFSAIGFRRGEKKGFTKPLTIAQMHEEEIKSLQKQKKALKYEVRDAIKELKNYKKGLKKMESNKEKLKEELNSIDKSLKIARETLRDKNTSISSLEAQKSSLKAVIGDLRSEKDNLLEENIQIQTANLENRKYNFDDFAEDMQNLAKKFEKKEEKPKYTNELNTIPDIDTPRRHR